MPLARKPKFKAVFFDLDGTLIEFKFDVKGSRLSMIEWLRKKGFDVSTISENTKTQDMMLWIKKQVANGNSGMDYDSIHAHLCSILDGFEYRAFNVARPHPGSLRLLKYLKSEQVLSALVTNSGRKPVTGLLGEFGFLPYLSPVITRDEVQNLKPDPEGILKALSELALRTDEAVYVGDSVIDIQAARRAGIACIALSQGYYRADELALKKPDFLIDTIDQVERIIFS